MVSIRSLCTVVQRRLLVEWRRTHIFNGYEELLFGGAEEVIRCFGEGKVRWFGEGRFLWYGESWSWMSFNGI